jgi:hypothetical protein
MASTTVNYPLDGGGAAGVSFPIRALGADPVAGQEEAVARIAGMALPGRQFAFLYGKVDHVGVTARFLDVVQTFATPAGHTPAGFRIEATLEPGRLLAVDLVRDISYDADGMKRPTNIIFSADSANPYEVAPIAPMLGNLTCNPGIVYDLFINNPKANVGGLFTTRDEVMVELGRILGPGVDVSVELNNPFEEDFGKILEEVQTFEEILTPYRLVVKVPHTGPVNGQNVGELLAGDKKFSVAYHQPPTADALRGHNLALKLREHGYRINFTLMFEPHQAALALQAKPAFVNAFIRHRHKQSAAMAAAIDGFERSQDETYLATLRDQLLAADYLPKGDAGHDLKDCLRLARHILAYRRVEDPYGADGLDNVRHTLRWLRQSNLPDTRLIICSMEGDDNYPDIDRLMADPEYADIVHRIVITAEPGYLARFTSANQVVSYQRRFMNAAATAK